MLSCVQLFVTSCTVAHKPSPSVGLSQHGYWSRLPFPLSGHLPDPRIEPAPPALAGGFFTAESPGKPLCLKQQFLNGAVLPSWCIWQGLQMFSVVTTRKHCWHPLLGGDQGIRSASCIAQAAPQQRLTYPAQMSVVLRLRSRSLEVLLFSLVFGCSATALQHN